MGVATLALSRSEVPQRAEEDTRRREESCLALSTKNA